MIHTLVDPPPFAPQLFVGVDHKRHGSSVAECAVVCSVNAPCAGFDWDFSDGRCAAALFLEQRVYSWNSASILG